MHYRLKKLGFKFGKMRRLCLRKEGDKITKKRRIYLKKRVEYNAIIAENKAVRKEWIDNKCIGPLFQEIIYMYLDKSYVNRNHSREFSWYHPDDPFGCAANIPTGKGERLVMLTGITKEYGMLECDIADVTKELTSLMLFQARKATGDYHLNMDADMFSMWLVGDEAKNREGLFHILRRMGIKAILVMDNASYHCTPAPGSINVKSMTTKKQVTDFLDQYTVPYRVGRAKKDGTGGDNLEQLKDKLTAWLKDNAAAHGLLVGVTRCTKLCKDWGHYPPLFTPPYHPELQPIERLWRDVKQYVSREFTGTRTVTVLREHVIAGFRKYGSAASCAGRIRKAVEEEDLYVREGVYAEVIDLTLLDDDSDDELELAEDELGVFDDSDDEADDVYDD